MDITYFSGFLPVPLVAIKSPFRRKGLVIFFENLKRLPCLFHPLRFYPKDFEVFYNFAAKSSRSLLAPIRNRSGVVHSSPRRSLTIS